VLAEGSGELFASHLVQRLHLRHGLDRYGATARLEYEDATESTLRPCRCRGCRDVPVLPPLARGGAARAAKLIAELL
jgi:hypothetical protein